MPDYSNCCILLIIGNTLLCAIGFGRLHISFLPAIYPTIHIPFTTADNRKDTLSDVLNLPVLRLNSL